MLGVRLEGKTLASSLLTRVMSGPRFMYSMKRFASLGLLLRCCMGSSWIDATEERQRNSATRIARPFIDLIIIHISGPLLTASTKLTLPIRIRKRIGKVQDYWGDEKQHYHMFLGWVCVLW
jgi:hypothetical protein